MKKIVLSLFLYSITAYAAPEGFELISGQANPPQVDLQGQTHIQSTQDSVVHWNSFSLNPQEVLIFDQPQETSSILNRVVGSNPSEILGKLQSNGIIYLINQNGIVIGPTGVIETAGFLASTLDILTQDFFTKNTLEFFSKNPGSILNLGTISCPIGQITLLARSIENQGELNGSVQAIACTKATLQIDNQRLFIQTSQKLDTPENLQELNTSIQKNPYAHAIKHSGRIKSNTLGMQNGRVYLFAQEGVTEITGSVEASDIKLLGKEVLLKEQAILDASSDAQGGRILIGGDYKGQNPKIPLAEHVLIDSEVQIHADALQTGDGGEIIIWSEENTEFLGSLSAKGGDLSGNGGFAEVSGKRGVEFKGSVDLTAINGKTGNLLIDPDFIIITPSGTAPATGQVFNTPGFAQISGASIGNALATASLTLQANQIIAIQDNITSTSGNDLTLQAGTDIAASSSALFTISLNGGNFNATFNSSGPVFPSSSSGIFQVANLTINTAGGNITIQQGDLGNFFNGTILLTNTTLNAGSGFVALTTNPNNTYMKDGINVNSSAINAGNITLSGTAKNGVVLNASNLLCPGLMSITGNGSSGVGIEINNNSEVIGNIANLTSTLGSIVLEDTVVISDTLLTVQTPNDCILQANEFLTVLQPNNGIADVTIGGNLTLISGNASLAADTYIGSAAFPTAGGLMQFTVGGNVSLTSTSAQTYSLIGYGNSTESLNESGDIIFNHVGGDVTLQGANSGAGDFGFAQIGHLSGGGFSNTLDGNIYLLVDGLISVIGGNAGTSSYAQIGHGGAAPFTTTGQLTAIAGKDIIMQSNAGPANIINAGGNVTLVTDNLFPTAPLIGPGFFSINSNLSASGEMRIYTAVRSQNQINDLINGAPFTPGTLFVNTSEEMWATYYPGGSYGGGPFTIYYKDGTIEAIEDVFEFSVANAEFNAESSDILPIVNPPIYQAKLGYFSERELIDFDPYRRVLRYRTDQRESYSGGPFTIYKDGTIEAIEDTFIFAVDNAESSDILPIVNPPIYQEKPDYFSQRELIGFDPYRRVLRYRTDQRNLTR